MAAPKKKPAPKKAAPKAAAKAGISPRMRMGGEGPQGKSQPSRKITGRPYKRSGAGAAVRDLQSFVGKGVGGAQQAVGRQVNKATGGGRDPRLDPGFDKSNPLKRILK